MAKGNPLVLKEGGFSVGFGSYCLYASDARIQLYPVSVRVFDERDAVSLFRGRADADLSLQCRWNLRNLYSSCGKFF